MRDVVNSLSGRRTTSRRSTSCFRTKNTKYTVSVAPENNTASPGAQSNTNRAASSYPRAPSGTIWAATVVWYTAPANHEPDGDNAKRTVAAASQRRGEQADWGNGVNGQPEG